MWVLCLSSYRLFLLFSPLVEHHLFLSVAFSHRGHKGIPDISSDISFVPMESNGAWCSGAVLESAEGSTVPFLMVLAQLSSSAEKPETLNPRQMHSDATALFPTPKLCIVHFFFSPGPCPLSACLSSLSKHLWKHFLSIVTMLIIPKFYCLHWTSLSPNWSPVLFFIVLHCGVFFLSISSWTAHCKNLPKAEHILPLLHVLIMNILSYRTRKLRKIINFVSSAKGKWKFYNIYIDKKFEGELCSVLTDSIKKAIIIDVWYVDKKKNVLMLWKKSNVIKIRMLRIHT